MASSVILACLNAITEDALLSAWGVAGIATPLTHLAGVALCRPKEAGATSAGGSASERRQGASLAFVVSGGPRHIVLQALSFALWLCALLVAVPVLHARWQQAPQAAHPEVLPAAMALAAYCALLFQLKALLVFDPAQRPPRLLGRALLSGAADLRWDVSHLPSRTARAYIMGGIGLLWVGLGGALLLATELLSDRISLAAYYALAAACVTCGAFTTHGLAGFLSHSPAAAGAPRARRGGAAVWRFWQPFRGGTAFVLAQALGWALYSSALVAILWLLWQAVAGVAYCMRCWAVAAGAAMFTSEVCLALSLLTFNRGSLLSAAKHLSAPLRLRFGLRQRLTNAAVIAVLYIPMHIFAAVALLTFLVLPPAHAAALWSGGLFVYYSVTAFGQPEHTGRREWPAMQAWLGQSLEAFLPAWLGSFQVALDGGPSAAERFDPSGRHVFGFVHHGLYPLGAGYLPFLPSFRRLVPVRPVTLTASVCVTVPLLRDICLWLGVRIVSRRTFEHTLRERGAVLICPGGQAEMCLTNRLHRHQEFTVYAGHKGFVRIALQHGAALVPVLALGEADSLHNLIEWPTLQRWCTKKLGFPIPFVIGGRWCLPLPSRTHLKFVVGAPIPAPKLQREGEPTQAEVDEQHAAFYAALERLWAAHAPQFPGYQDVKLVVHRP